MALAVLLSLGLDVALGAAFSCCRPEVSFGGVAVVFDVEDAGTSGFLGF